jgi:hypothetical protein
MCDSYLISDFVRVCPSEHEPLHCLRALVHHSQVKDCIPVLKKATVLSLQLTKQRLVCEGCFVLFCFVLFERPRGPVALQKVDISFRMKNIIFLIGCWSRLKPVYESEAVLFILNSHSAHT